MFRKERKPASLEEEWYNAWPKKGARRKKVGKALIRLIMHDPLDLREYAVLKYNLACTKEDGPGLKDRWSRS